MPVPLGKDFFPPWLKGCEEGILPFGCGGIKQPLRLVPIVRYRQE